MRILAINVEIGHGHPNYLDYVLQALKQIDHHIEIKYWDILTQEKGFTKLFWQISKNLYSIGAKGGITTELYNRLRDSTRSYNLSLCNAPSSGFSSILVSHPLLDRSIGSVWYIHGEIAAPKESVLKNIAKIIVPTTYTANKFIAQGIKPEQILITGLLLSLDLVANAKENYLKRVSRLKSERPLTIGFFISGAYPPPHIKKVIDGIISVTKENYRVIAFLGTDLVKARNFLSDLNRLSSQRGKSSASILFVSCNNRSDYQKRVNRLLPLLDVFVAPSHEHTSWALGLGLPIFVLFPMIGNYAKENFRFAHKQGVALPIPTRQDAQNLGITFRELRSAGMLLKMAENGFGRFSINGALGTAQLILRGTDV